MSEPAHDIHHSLPLCLLHVHIPLLTLQLLEGRSNNNLLPEQPLLQPRFLAKREDSNFHRPLATCLDIHNVLQLLVLHFLVHSYPSPPP